VTAEVRDSDRFETRESLVLEEIDDEVVILDLQKNVYFGLNEVAKLVWRGLERDQTIGEIVDELVEQFDVEREVLTCDVHAFVGEALENELISRVTE
jgi:hypothetical protein